MDLTSRTELKSLLKKYDAKPEKYLGQHFLLSKRALRQMIQAAEIKKGDHIIEIGPGVGTLTQELAKTGGRVIAIEKDQLMVKILKEALGDYKNVSIIQADARKLDWNNLSTPYPQIPRGRTSEVRPRYKIVANLPYNISNFLIRSWLESKNPPDRIVVIIQKEVAKRIQAKPPHMNLLAASVQFFADAKIINYVPAEVFWPKPKVDSAILLIEPKVKKPEIDQKRFFEILKAGFSQPRKQLAGNLVKKLKMPRERLISIFKDLNISEKTRAENLSVKEWLAIARELGE